MTMVTSVLRLGKRYIAKATLAFSLLFSMTANAQTGGPIAGYTYLGSYIVNGQPHYYYVSTASMTWPNAKTAASTLAGGGGYLATLTSQGENDYVWNQLRNYLLYGSDFVVSGPQVGVQDGPGLVSKTPPCPNGEVFPYDCSPWGDDRHPWIGFTDAASEGTTENNWIYTNNENCNTFTNWDSGEPNDFGVGEDYAQMLAFAPDPATTNQQGGKWNDWFNTQSQTFIVEFGPNSCTPPPTGNEGCSHGYWKNHPQSWPATGYTRNQALSTVWSNTAPYASTSLSTALSFSGGSGVDGAKRNLFKQAVAALLNAAHPSVDYPLTVAQVISQVNTALASGNRATMLTLAGTLDGYNNLHNSPLCSGTATTESSRAPGSGVESAEIQRVFSVSGYPNPSKNGFSIRIDGASSDRVSIRVTDMTGRLIEQRANLASNQVIQIGTNYSPGLYHVEVAQGENSKQLRLVKQ